MTEFSFTLPFLPVMLYSWYWRNELRDVDIQLNTVLFYFSLTVKAATLIFISECGSAIPSAKKGKSGFIYNLVKS